MPRAPSQHRLATPDLDGTVAGDALASLPGLKPGSQRRSKELVERLFNTALVLLKERDFDTLTIDDLCVRADATVGSFYARFENKQAFIQALQHLVFERTMRSLVRDRDLGRVPLDDLDVFFAWVCAGTVEWFRRYEGFIRASSKLTSVDPKAWAPLRALGSEKTAWCLPLCARIVGRDAGPALERAVRAALQVLHGTLNNIVLIDPGPLRLHDAETAHFLSRLVVSCVQEGISSDARAWQERRPGVVESKKSLNPRGRNKARGARLKARAP